MSLNLEEKAFINEEFEDVNLRQAIHWLAVGLQPVREPYESALKRPLEIYPDTINREDIDRAMGLLFIALKEGVITSHGLIVRCNAVSDEDGIPDRDTDGHYVLNYQEGQYESVTLKDKDGMMLIPPYEIPAKAWEWKYIDWFKERLITLDSENGYTFKVYHHVNIPWPELRKLAAKPAPVEIEQSVNTTSYTTPYLQYMHRAIVHFGITKDNQPKHEVLASWFVEQSISDVKISPNDARAMASLVRLPESRKGGNRPHSVHKESKKKTG